MNLLNNKLIHGDEENAGLLEYLFANCMGTLDKQHEYKICSKHFSRQDFKVNTGSQITSEADGHFFTPNDWIIFDGEFDEDWLPNYLSCMRNSERVCL